MVSGCNRSFEHVRREFHARPATPQLALKLLLGDRMAFRQRAIGDRLRRVARHSRKPSVDLLEAGLVDAIPELAILRGVPQDSRWHPEGDVLTHSLLALDRAAELFDASHLERPRREVVLLSALFHDVGKSRVTRAGASGVTAVHHAEVGAAMIEDIGSRMYWRYWSTLAVASLVRHHMAPVSVVGTPSIRAVMRLSAWLDAAGTSLTEWSVVVDADGLARGSRSMPNRAGAWMRVAGVAPPRRRPSL